MEAISFGNNIPGFEIGKKDAAAVIVIQEWWGVTEIIKAHAEKISQAGYRCLIPDLYKGKIGVDKEEASHLMGSLDFKAAIGELTQAVDYLKSTGSSTVGCIGFCMGGALAFCAGQHSGLDCVAPFYGTPRSPEICTPELIKVPLQAHFGEEDSLEGFSDAKTARKVEAAMKEAGCPSEFFFYKGAGHAFMNQGEEAIKKREHMGFVEPPSEVQEIAWKRIFEFFESFLKS